jgi:hypothetical protein
LGPPDVQRLTRRADPHGTQLRELFAEIGETVGWLDGVTFGAKSFSFSRHAASSFASSIVLLRPVSAKIVKFLDGP